MSRVRNEFYLRAAAVTGESPSWQAFMGELELYTQNSMSEMLQASPQELPAAQGRAQSLNTLMQELKSCRETAEKIQAAKANRPLPKHSAGA